MNERISNEYQTQLKISDPHADSLCCLVSTEEKSSDHEWSTNFWSMIMMIVATHCRLCVTEKCHHVTDRTKIQFATLIEVIQFGLLQSIRFQLDFFLGNTRTQ